MDNTKVEHSLALSIAAFATPAYTVARPMLAWKLVNYLESTIWKTTSTKPLNQN
jgi:hypothetical protein